jgi:hypothetical protein
VRDVSVDLSEIGFRSGESVRDEWKRTDPRKQTQDKFARDLQDRLGIRALLALPAPFRICKLQIPLAARETDPVSGHHILKDLAAIKELEF